MVKWIRIKNTEFRIQFRIHTYWQVNENWRKVHKKWLNEWVQAYGNTASSSSQLKTSPPPPAIPPLSSKVKWLKEKEEQEKIDHKGGVLIQQKEGYQPGFFPTDLITKERARFQLGQAAVVMDRPTQLRDLLSVYTDRLKDCLYKEKRGIETLNLQEELREMKNIFSFIFFFVFSPAPFRWWLTE